ncbi:DUF4011 domain-containing protein [Ammonicoccus fulvus]|uniref:DUF4011 domain-containing protein n=1 Tax=Ammonicoccus fulvus TaxID=3138240 RepID=A0ABZ3FM81_9ACTN
MKTGVTIETVATPWVNHAMAHTGLPFLRRVIVDLGALGEAPAEATVRVLVRDAFGTQITRDWARTVRDPDPAVAWELDDLDVRFDPGAISGIEEEADAEIEVAVELEGERVAVSHTPLRVLASRQWVLDPRAPLLSLELLAAFVQPNHTAVAALLPAIGDKLAKATGSGSLGLGGRTPEGIDKIVSAAFEVVHDRDIYYAAPPASWGYGQKVRTPGDVLDDRVGTCLDTTLTLAAVLEQIGIPPVVWIGQGHSFLGYWRYLDRGLPDAASTSVAQAANAVDLGLMGVVETTMVTREKRPPRDLFRRAAQEPHDSWFTGRSHQLLGVVDIAMARMLRVHPLPARRQRPDGVTEVVEYVPAAREESAYAGGAEAADATGPVAERESGEAAPPRIRAWKKALLDLTLRNKLLNLDQPMTQVRLQVPSGELGRLATMLQSGRVITVRAHDDLSGAVLAATERNAHTIPGDVQRDMLEVRATIYSQHSQATHQGELDRVRFRAQSGRRETGANPLVLTLGRVDWKLGDRDLSAPLVLVPAEIRGLTMPYRIAFDSSGDISINHSLLEKLRTEFGFTVPALDDLPVAEDGLVDVAEILRRFRAALDAAQLPFRVIDEARLTISGFTGYLLWRDLDEHWERFLESPLVKHLVETPMQEYADPAEVDASGGDSGEPTLDELVAVSPIPADGSQAEAIALARAGRSFVLEGPPGTGKSQTITNILVDQMVQGRRVLFVAEKGAALDVVRKRLGEVGMLPYTLDLHDHNARPATVKAGLKAALAQQAQPDADSYRVAGQDVGAATALLVGYRDRLHSPNAAGLSLWSAHAQELARGEGPTLPVSTASVVREGFDAGELRRAVAAAVAPLAELGAGAASAWGFAGSTGASVDEVMTAVARVDALRDGRGRPARGTSFEAVARGIATVADLRSVAWLLTEPGLGDQLGELGSGRWGDALAELRGRTSELARRGGPIVGQFTPAVFEVDFGPVRQEVREAQASFFLGRKGRLLRAAGAVLAHLRPGAEVDAKGLPELVETIAGIAGEQGSLRHSWRSLPGMADVGDLALADPAVEPEIARLVAARLEAARLLGGLNPTLAREVIAARAGGPVGAPLRELADAWSALAEATGSRGEDQKLFAGESGLLGAWAEGTQARRDPALLGRWRRVTAALEPLAGKADEARWALLTGSVAAEDAPAAFDRGVAAASFAERWAAGGFEEFHPASHDRAAERYVSAGAALRTSLKSVLPAAVLGRRPFKPAGSGRAVFGRAAALDRELNRSRGGASVRQLIADHGAVIGEVTPCVLVSPDSLARFVPPGAMEFDLVVFDEASQIRVPDAIGALGRARACVVAGDSKQLPPTAFAQISVDEEEVVDDEFVVVPDEESLLGECVQAGLPRHWLSWHYRSTDEALIAFSNDKYYEGRLSSFPAFPASQFDSGISFTRVDGHFIRSVAKGEPREKGLLRTNPVEATAVVDEVLRRWRQRERSIGVVTFNVQQRNLVQRMLWESGVEGVAESLVLADDGLFVKNLENVQGDERDVIIFSTAFSANASGTLPLNFGPLNRAGGERRLNVAVTRARRRVMVFSSFEPEDIRVEQTNSVGVHHLRAYLELAREGVAPAVVQRVGAVDRHRDDLAEALRERGLEVETNVGLSDFRLDLVVSDPARGDRSALAVLLDGPGWAERATTGDRDGLPEQVLRTIMGWPAIERVWLPEWLGDREGTLGRLVEAVAAVDGRLAVGEATSQAVFTPYEPGGDSPVLDAGEEPADGGVEVDEPELVSGGPAGPIDRVDGVDGVGVEGVDPAGLGEADPLALLTSTVSFDEGPYAEPELELRPRGRMDRLGYPGAASQGVTALMGEIIAAAGPISPRRVARIVVVTHNISRLTEQRFTTLRDLLPGDVRRDPEGFLWPAGRDPLRWEGYRSGSDLKDRPLGDIALREIGNAQVDLVRRAVGISVDELFRETMRIFGGTRATDSTRDRLAAALDQAVVDGRVRIAGDIVSA